MPSSSQTLARSARSATSSSAGVSLARKGTAEISFSSASNLALSAVLAQLSEWVAAVKALFLMSSAATTTSPHSALRISSSFSFSNAQSSQSSRRRTPTSSSSSKCKIAVTLALTTTATAFFLFLTYKYWKSRKDKGAADDDEDKVLLSLDSQRNRKPSASNSRTSPSRIQQQAQPQISTSTYARSTETGLPTPPSLSRAGSFVQSPLVSAPSSLSALLATSPKSAKGLVLTVSAKNILFWNPSQDPNHPNYAFVESAVSFLQGLVTSGRYLVHIITVINSDKEQAQISNILKNARLFAAGLDPRRVLFCQSEEGKGHMIRHLQPHTHVDTDDSLIEMVAPHVKRVIRVRRNLQFIGDGADFTPLPPGTKPNSRSSSVASAMGAGVKSITPSPQSLSPVEATPTTTFPISSSGHQTPPQFIPMSSSPPAAAGLASSSSSGLARTSSVASLSGLQRPQPPSASARPIQMNVLSPGKADNKPVFSYTSSSGDGFPAELRGRSPSVQRLRELSGESLRNKFSNVVFADSLVDLPPS